ncbi:hypothetical protein pipiens_004698 [Culex pipiens pipiens]|uniref:Eukaryotic translation initiation factor 3 subunit G N-terminal domain-containing protein n=1 Tax=Culex pipiens pipiens TaxID=38569 RepID=A0ABD1CG04_CULPP
MFTTIPALDEIKSFWADEIELESGSLPPPTEIVENGQKVVTEYKDDKKVKVVRTYKITRLFVPKSVAKRKNWAKFGDSAGAEPADDSNNALDSLKNIAKCRICEGEHWSVQCPYQGTSYEAKPVPAAQPESSSAPIKSGKYVPPSMRDSQKAALGAIPRGRDDTTAIRISNLSETMT